MAGRILELAIAIKGRLDQAYTESMRRAISEAGNLQRRLREVSQAAQGSQRLMQRMGDLRGIQANIERFRELKRSVSDYTAQLAQAQSNANKYAAELRRSQTATEQLRQRHEALTVSLKELKGKIPNAEWRQMNTEAKALKATLKESEASTKAAGRAFEQAKNQAASLRSKLAEQQAELQRIRAAMSSAGYGVQNLAQNEIRLRQEIEQTTRAMARAAQEQARLSARRTAQEANHTAQTNAFNAYGNFQNAIGTAQTIVSPFADAISSAMEFEAEMSKVKSMTQMDNIKLGNWERVNSEMQKLTEQAKEMGRTTQFTSVQAAQAQFELAKAGYDTEKVYASLPHVLNMAAVENMELGDAARIATNIMAGFGLGADKIEHSIDVLAYTSTHANTDLRSLGETMKYAAPVAKSFGASLEETATMAKFMADAGITGSQAGTSLRQGLLRLVAPPKKASKAMEEMGVSLSDAQAEWANAQATAAAYGITLDKTKGPGEQLISVIKQIESGMAGASDQEKIAALNAITGINAVSGWAAVMANSSGSIEDFYEKLKTCDGAATQAAKTMQDNTKGAFTRFGSAAEAVSQSIGDVFLPTVREAAETAAVYATALAEWVSEHQTIVKVAGIAAATIAGITIAAAGVQMAFAGWAFITSTIDLVATSQTLLAAKTKLSAAATMFHAGANAILGASMNALRNPITTVTTLFGGIPAKLAGARAAIMGIPAMISGAFTAIPGIVSGAFAGLATVGLPVIAAILAIAAVVAVVAANFDKLKETATIVFNHISGTVEAWAATIQAKFSEALSKITEVWNSITGQSLESSELIGAIFNNLGFLLGAAFDVAAGIVGTAISVIINLVASVAQIVGGVINIIAGLLTGDWSRAWEGAGQAVEGFAGGTLGTIKTIAEGVGSIFDTLMGKSAEVQRQAEQAKAQQDLIAQSRSANVNADYMPNEGMMQTAQAAQETAQATAEASANAQQLSASVGETGVAAQQTTSYMQQLQTVMGQVPAQAQTAFSGMGEQSAAAAQAVNTNMQQIPTQTQATFQQLPPIATQGTDAIAQEFSQLATKCQPGGEAFVQAANQWGQQAYESISNWSSQMAQVVVDRLSSAWAQISSQFSAGLNVNVTTSGAGIAHNAEGGIYKKGAFLTTFAEKSPEAAIPLDGSKRAVSLWNTVGQMLGMIPKEAAGQQIAAETVKPQGLDEAPLLGGIADSLFGAMNRIKQTPIVNMVEAMPPEIKSVVDVAAPPIPQTPELPPIMNIVEALPPEISTIMEAPQLPSIPAPIINQAAPQLPSIPAPIINQAAPIINSNVDKPRKEQAAFQTLDWLKSGIENLASTGGKIINSLMPMKNDIELPPIMNMVEALPPEISTIMEAPQAPIINQAAPQLPSIPAPIINQATPQLPSIPAPIINQAAPIINSNVDKPRKEQAAFQTLDWLKSGIENLASTGGKIINSLMPMKNDIELPPIMNMVEALPPEISTIAEVVSPPTEAEMAAAPVALEPSGMGSGTFEINFNPQITIQGNADSGTVSQMGDVLSKLKAELMREVRREFGNMKSDFEHQERRRSYAT